MRESRTLGSVRGALSNGRPYRDHGGDGVKSRMSNGSLWLSRKAIRALLGVRPFDPKHDQKVLVDIAHEAALVVDTRNRPFHSCS